MLIDLTEWFGSGNEPTTIDAFVNKFYKKSCINIIFVLQFISLMAS